MSARTLLMAAAPAGPPGASLNLSFMAGTLDPRITFTRASTATYTDVTGTMQTAATNAPRWDYDPTTATLRGLLIEEARTNLLLNSAALGTQGVAVTAQAYTLSFYGTGTITKSGAASGALAGTGPLRVTQTFTPTAGTLTLTVTGSVLNAQLEAGAFATSYIPTAAAAATRAADNCQILPANMGWFVSPGGSWFAEFINLVPAPNSGRVIGYPQASSKTQIYVNPSNLVGMFDGLAVVTTSNVVTVGAISKAASTWAANLGRACLNGAGVASAALTGGFSDAPGWGTGIMQYGVPADGLTGYIRRVRYWPRVLSDAEMQSVTR